MRSLSRGGEPVRALTRTALSIVAVVATAGLDAASAEKHVVLDPAKSKVTFTLDATAHNVEGVLALKSGDVRFDPASGTASGEIVVQLAGGKTGNDRRDRKMHEEVLETSKYPTATFHVRRVAGTFNENGSSQLGLEGTLDFHGSEHPLTLPAKVEAHGSAIKATFDVTIPFVAWGLKDPSVFVLRVEKEVVVHVAAEGSLRD